MRLNPDDDDDFYNEDYDYDDDYEEDEPVKSKSSFRKDKRKAEEDDYEEDHSIHEKAVKSSPKVTPIRPVKKQGGSGMEVCVIKPTSVEDAREITETLLNNRTVVLNVEDWTSRSHSGLSILHRVPALQSAVIFRRSPTISLSLHPHRLTFPAIS